MEKNIVQLGKGGIAPLGGAAAPPTPPAFLGGLRPPNPPGRAPAPPKSSREAFSRMELSLGVQLDFIALIDLHRTRAL